jgi:peptidoglycan lytic transglycosylase
MYAIRTLAMAVICVCAASPTDSAAGPEPTPQTCTHEAERPVYSQTGVASWYRPSSPSRRTASGERTSRRALTAAHRSLPFGSVVRVTNLRNCREVKLVVNDRGPFVPREHRRILDVSTRAALVLGMKKEGVAPIRLEAYSSDQQAGP